MHACMELRFESLRSGSRKKENGKKTFSVVQVGGVEGNRCESYTTCSHL